MTEMISIEPISGYGWVTVSNDRTRDAPSLFDLKLGPGEPLCGVVVTPSHELGGASVIFTSRIITYPYPWLGRSPGLRDKAT